MASGRVPKTRVIVGFVIAVIAPSTSAQTFILSRAGAEHACNRRFQFSKVSLQSLVLGRPFTFVHDFRQFAAVLVVL